MFEIVAVVFIGILTGIGFFDWDRKLIRSRRSYSASVPSWITAERERQADGAPG